jgi:hypothetical protein
MDTQNRTLNDDGGQSISPLLRCPLIGERKSLQSIIPIESNEYLA